MQEVLDLLLPGVAIAVVLLVTDGLFIAFRLALEWIVDQVRRF